MIQVISRFLGWALGGNTNGSEKYIGTNDNFSFPIRCNGIEIGRFVPEPFPSAGFSGDGRLYLGQTTTDNGSNAGMQTSCTRPNRAQWRFNQYGANTAAGGITTFKSRSLTIGSSPVVAGDAVIVGDIIHGHTAIGVTNNALIPIAYTQRVTVTQNANGNVSCDWEIQLCPKTGTTNSIRKTYGITSEGVPKLIEVGSPSPQPITGYAAGIATLGAAGNVVIPNTNVLAGTRFMLTVQDSGAAPTGIIYQSARTVGTDFTITSTAGIADAGVQVYYQLYEQML